MLKFTGALMICAVCIIYGFTAADRLRKRRDFLDEFITSLSVLETEITFGKYTLDRIFKKIGDGKKLYRIYSLCAENLEKQGIKAAWAGAVSEIAETVELKQRDVNAISALGTELGMSDINGQQKAIRRTAELTKAAAKEAEEEYKRMGRAYRGCGILAGLFCIIMLI